jgi:hypothetical protein
MAQHNSNSWLMGYVQWVLVKFVARKVELGCAMAVIVLLSSAAQQHDHCHGAAGL